MSFAERRQYERVPFSCDLTIEDLGNGRRCKGCSINLSRGGIGFYADSFLATGAHVGIHLWVDRTEGRRPVELLATVRWARVEDRGAVLGAEFDCALTPAEQPLLCVFLDRR